MLLGQLKIDAGLVSQEWRLALRANYRPYLHRRYPFQAATVSARQIVGLEG